MSRPDAPPSNNPDAHRGKQALARVLEQLDEAKARIANGESTVAAVDRLWPDFKTAVGYAMSELRGAELEGVARWRENRHRKPGE